MEPVIMDVLPLPKTKPLVPRGKYNQKQHTTMADIVRLMFLMSSFYRKIFTHIIITSIVIRRNFNKTNLTYYQCRNRS